MARMIDADALRNKVQLYANEPVKMLDRRWDTRCTAIIADMIGMIDKAPAVDAAPVVHGRWVEVADFIWKCSVCGKEDCYAYTWGEVKRQDDLFCPRCGAKMDGDDDA